MAALAEELNIPNLPELDQTFLFRQLFPGDDHDTLNVSPLECPGYQGKFSVYGSESSMVYTPSDLSGTGGMWCEYIHAMPTWRQQGPHYDCVFVITDPELKGMHGMDVPHVHCFFSSKAHNNYYHCTVIHWFDHIGDGPDEATGMWMICPSSTWGSWPNTTVIHIDAIFLCSTSHSSL